MKDWNSSMNIQLVKKNNVDQDMLSYEKNLRQHKLKTAGMVVAVIAIIGLCLYGIKISPVSYTHLLDRVLSVLEK